MFGYLASRYREKWQRKDKNSSLLTGRSCFSHCSTANLNSGPSLSGESLIHSLGVKRKDYPIHHVSVPGLLNPPPAQAQWSSIPAHCARNKRRSHSSHYNLIIFHSQPDRFCLFVYLFFWCLWLQKNESHCQNHLTLQEFSLCFI